MFSGLLQPTHLIILMVLFGGASLISLVPFPAYKSGYDRGFRRGLESGLNRSSDR